MKNCKRIVNRQKENAKDISSMLENIFSKEQKFQSHRQRIFNSENLPKKHPNYINLDKDIKGQEQKC